jgi:hypothetical protein
MGDRIQLGEARRRWRCRVFYVHMFLACFGLTISQAKREPVPGWATGFNWERPGVVDTAVCYILNFARFVD